jgi:hypothetical protein
MITGPWSDCYKEFNPQTKELITSTHGRKEISRHSVDDISLQNKKKL